MLFVTQIQARFGGVGEVAFGNELVGRPPVLWVPVRGPIAHQDLRFRWDIISVDHGWRSCWRLTGQACAYGINQHVSNRREE